ncbi:MAG: capsular biosynthesis protein [Proteobacteria bacterium]|nr:capsular biosynthesis protein [Pseudomonadota bacterium]
MIDIHCHLLPGIDDGPTDIQTSLRMARALIEDGVEAVICTPHILPGLWHNTGPLIRSAVSRLRSHLANEGLQLELFSGADAHIAVDFAVKLQTRDIPTLADSRYVLVELPQHMGPVLIKQFFFQLLTAGYVPILSHPERLPWIVEQYAIIESLARSGVWLQITSGSLLGDFGRTAQYWCERMLNDGLAHVLATDAHDAERRRPNLSKGREAAAKRIGEREAENLVSIRPRAILHNEAPENVPSPMGQSDVPLQNA